MNNHLIPSHSVSHFKFWRNGVLREGITYNNEIYGLVDCFDLSDRHIASRILHNLNQQNVPAVITIGSRQPLSTLEKPAQSILAIISTE
ncbi:hypothetical protein Pse7367_2955 [Thalassoporum mexicanum PCC 7367]|uniref:hypothetical protein n=1 Tax=Thalassoporum mexicanum TaxID=3457544 RepID=UPI00029F81AB|nr:hypothetical protein [Pseudanabaena sp. PCC 7367]AFY71206.1 hypothetical protein Pse7367_2955 [Pseudanabaena sp. PCC 7367]